MRKRPSWVHRLEVEIRDVPEYPEMTLKEFLISEGDRLSLTRDAVYKRVMRGYYPDLKIFRVNKRLVFIINTKKKMNCLYDYN
jgi:hypothetical protein